MELLSHHYLEDIKAHGFEYRFDNGLKLVLIEDNNYPRLDINVTLKTPPIDSRGATHVIEHCIASEIYSQSIVKQYARTLQNRTSYEFVVVRINALKDILKGIFFPRFKSDKNIFLREGWRLENNNNQYAIKGIVFNEIKESFTSPLYCIMNHIPYSLYGNNVLGHIGGGTLGRLLDLRFEDIIEYHNDYYVLNNCCIYIRGYNCVIEVADIISSLFNSLRFPACNEISLHLALATTSLRFYYPATIKRKNDCFISSNYPVKRPGNQFEYNLYNQIASDCDGILAKRFDKKRQDGVITTVFKNSLYGPYISVILAYGQGEDSKFIEECNQAINEAANHMDINDTPNSVLADYYTGGNIDGLRLAKYIMEGFCSDNNPFAYVNSCDKTLKSSYERFLDELPKQVENRSVIKLSYTSKIKSDKKTMIRKAMKNGCINEYRPLPAGPRAIVCQNQYDTSNYITNCLEKQVETPDKYKMDNIQYYLYESNNSAINIHIYFDMSCFDYDEICCAAFISKYMNYRFSMENTSSITCLCKALDDVCFRFIIRINSNSHNLLHDFNKIEILFNEILNGLDEYELINILKRNIMAYKLDFMNKQEHYVSSRVSSYLSPKGLFQEAVNGIGYYKYISENLNENMVYKIKQVSGLILNKKEAFVSIYANEPFKVLDIINKYQAGLIKSYKRAPTHSFTKNEGFIIPTQLNYITQGSDLEQMGYTNTEKYTLFCSIVTRNYLIPVLREKHNAYSAKLVKSGKNIIFTSLKDPNISSTFSIFAKARGYILKNRATITSEYSILKNNVRFNSDDTETNPYNDKSTLRIISPDYYKSENSILLELGELLDSDIDEFAHLIQLVIEQNCYCVMGNRKDIESTANLFSTVEDLF
jgi:Predicted Zn-dependent peptidases, insulinase-like